MPSTHYIAWNRWFCTETIGFAQGSVVSKVVIYPEFM